ncbi:hypothetical protein BHE74_00021843 [Ensete ventricosum]|nr:hypothetical protein BHE74_00021843 [Ensete ventricosum]
MVKHHDESSKMGQAEPLLQAIAGGQQVQTHSQTVGAAHEERDSEQDEREFGYSPRVEKGTTSGMETLAVKVPHMAKTLSGIGRLLP